MPDIIVTVSEGIMRVILLISIVAILCGGALFIGGWLHQRNIQGLEIDFAALKEGEDETS